MKSTAPNFLENSDVIYAVLKGTATDDEQALFDEWLETSDTNKQLFEKFRDGKALTRKYYAYERIDIDKNRRRLIKAFVRHRRMQVVRTCAAVIIPLVAIASTWLYIDRGNPDSKVNTITRITENVVVVMPDGTRVIIDRSADGNRVAMQGDIALLHRDGQLIHEKQTNADTAYPQAQSWGAIEVPKGITFNTVLEDGTLVWLNAGSRLRYPLAFAGDERRVHLEGEAYFDIVKDNGKPFIVETQALTLRVLGTRFNIYAYPDEPGIHTSLVAGSVLLRAKTTDAETVLTPGHQAQLGHTANDFTIHDIDPATVGLWRNDLFIFGGNTLERVFHELARWYDFEYSFDDPRTAGFILMGEIPKYDDIERIFQQMETLGQIEIETKKNAVTIRAKKKYGLSCP